MNEPFDPNKAYDQCCHPRNFPVGTTLRDTYDQWLEQQVVEQQARVAAERQRINEENARGDQES